MKGIHKNPEPAIFTEWKAKANEDWQPKYDNLQKPEKPAVRLALLQEQGYLCAYCCCSIEDSTSIVIEHFIPQSEDENQALNYENLFACCDGTKVENTTNVMFYCCDESKKDQFKDENGLILLKPTHKNDNGFICEQAFSYTTVGAINAKDTTYKEQATFTINLLHLDNRELRRQREAACAFLFDGDDVFDFTPQEAQKLKNNYATLENNRFLPFSNTVLYFLNAYF